MRGLVPKKPKPRRLVPTKTKTIWRTQVRKFHFSSICNVLPSELRLFWYSTRVLNRHLANNLPTCGQQLADSRPTNGQQSANCRQKIFVEGGKRQSADSRPTVGRLSVDCCPTVGRLSSNCWPTVGRLLADCRPTVGQQSADSFLGELFFIFSVMFSHASLDERFLFFAASTLDCFKPFVYGCNCRT